MNLRWNLEPATDFSLKILLLAKNQRLSHLKIRYSKELTCNSGIVWNITRCLSRQRVYVNTPIIQRISLIALIYSMSLGNRIFTGVAWPSKSWTWHETGLPFCKFFYFAIWAFIRSSRLLPLKKWLWRCLAKFTNITDKHQETNDRRRL